MFSKNDVLMYVYIFLICRIHYFVCYEKCYVFIILVNLKKQLDKYTFILIISLMVRLFSLNLYFTIKKIFNFFLLVKTQFLVKHYVLGT